MVATYILIIAIIILICLVLTKVSSKLGMPMLLAFILLGMVFGSDGIFRIYFDDYEVAEKICSFALIFIMFYGGFGTNKETAQPVMVKAVLLSSIGVFLTAISTGFFCYIVLGISFWESMLIGSVISSTDAASVFSILRSKQINLKDNTAPMLEVESGSNDPCSYMLTIAVLSIMNGSKSGWQLIAMLFLQFIFGILFGVITAIVAIIVINRMKYAKSGVDSTFVFSVALISFAGSSMIGGNGYLSTYITGFILGNRSFYNKKSLVHFFDGITMLMQMLIFFLLGLLSFPSQLPNIMGSALAIALFLTFISRPLSVFAVLSPFRCSLQQKVLVSWSGIRGAASIVFAIMATIHPAYLKQDIFHMVFFIVLFSITIQGTLLPFVAKKLHMIDENSNVMKTFSDYSDEIPIQFVKISITENHPWIETKIKDIALLPELLLVLIIRESERIVPNGDTTLMQGDVLVLSAFSLDEEMEGYLTEMPINQHKEWIGRSLEEINMKEETLIAVIKRNDEVIIPNGQTIVKENDIFVISHI